MKHQIDLYSADGTGQLVANDDNGMLQYDDVMEAITDARDTVDSLIAHLDTEIDTYEIDEDINRRMWTVTINGNEAHRLEIVPTVLDTAISNHIEDALRGDLKKSEADNARLRETVAQLELQLSAAKDEAKTANHALRMIKDACLDKSDETRPIVIVDIVAKRLRNLSAEVNRLKIAIEINADE